MICKENDQNVILPYYIPKPIQGEACSIENLVKGSCSKPYLLVIAMSARAPLKFGWITSDSKNWDAARSMHCEATLVTAAPAAAVAYVRGGKMRGTTGGGAA